MKKSFLSSNLFGVWITFITLFKPIRLYAIAPYDPCDEEEQEENFVPEGACLEEGSRIVGAIKISTSLSLESLVDDDAISAAVTAGTMRFITNIAGAWPKATSNKKPGKGYQREKHSSSSYAPSFTHYGVDANLRFWNAINHSKDSSMLFVFEDLSIWGFVDSEKKAIPMDIVGHPSSDGELGGQRQFEVDVTFTTKSLPYALLAPVIAGFTKAELSARFK